MNTVAIAELKARLSEHLRLVQAGESVVILDRRTPIARIVPLEDELRIARRASRRYEYRELAPLIRTDPLAHLAAEREERW